MHRQRDFLLLVILAAAAAATSGLGQTVAPLAGPTSSDTASTASVPDFSGIWTHPYYGVDPPISGQIEPHVRLNIVLWNANAGEVHDPEAALRRSLSLISRLAEPASGLHLVTSNTHTCRVDFPEIVLRRSVSLICRLAVPANGLRVVTRNTLT